MALAMLILYALLLSQAAARSLLSSSPSSLSNAAPLDLPAARYKPFRPYWKDKEAIISKIQGGGGGIFGASKAFEGSSEYVKMRYHMGPVLSQQMHIYIVWYGRWKSSDKSIIRDFLASVSSPQSAAVPQPSVQRWWSTVRLYTDQTLQNITSQLVVAGEHNVDYSHGHSLTRLTMQEVLKGALAENNGTLPVNPRRGIYLILTAGDVVVQDFCRAVCGFHYFSFPSIVGYTLPYAWVGHSEKQCPEVCAYPFAVPSYMTHTTPMRPPNASPAVDGMVSVVAHELAEISSNPLINAWYAGEDPTAPTEIADLCEGMYGTGAGGGYAGAVLTDARSGVNYNMHGVNGRRFLVQWIWDPVLSACHGPNASD
ncbi:protein EXORDIUM-like 3 [Selaginella moellendorffii]|uniref:protein EXORDIUM-like 3 n=1 Tax=Selaginella moellendorffii TaxID=88036 RepID=UPI000D1C2515|nr:protein EXORDIUM-like 3 [Selaginella moellendorffii]|eukprot:XP_024545335.1 protein EXORDIUM-like 3 [Selaginella moellendorffii]